MKLQFIHNVTTYIASHRLHLDYISFEKVATNDTLGSDVAAIKAKTDLLTFTLTEVNAVLGTAYDAAKTAASQTSVYETRDGNIKRVLTLAIAQNLVRNVAIGSVDYETVYVKADTDIDWTAPVSTKVRYFWYTTMGDTAPYKVGENG